jgi:hypothetical protein
MSEATCGFDGAARKRTQAEREKQWLEEIARRLRATIVVSRNSGCCRMTPASCDLP